MGVRGPGVLRPLSGPRLDAGIATFMERHLAGRGKWNPCTKFILRVLDLNILNFFY